ELRGREVHRIRGELRSAGARSRVPVDERDAVLPEAYRKVPPGEGDDDVDLLVLSEVLTRRLELRRPVLRRACVDRVVEGIDLAAGDAAAGVDRPDGRGVRRLRVDRRARRSDGLVCGLETLEVHHTEAEARPAHSGRTVLDRSGRNRGRRSR